MNPEVSNKTAASSGDELILCHIERAAPVYTHQPLEQMHRGAETSGQAS